MSEADRVSRRLVPLEERHVAEMTRIFNEHVADGFAAYPEKSLTEEAIASLLHQTENYPRVAVESTVETLLGFGFLRAYSPQATFAHTAQITAFLGRAYVRRGIGTAVLRHLESRARRQRITRILAHISSRNPASLAFHTKHGFVECGRFPGIGRKWGQSFDVVWMVKTLDTENQT